MTILTRNILFLLLLLISLDNAFAQVKRQYEDNKRTNRTIVVKEEGSNDIQILEDQFGDAQVGKVVRITMEKPPKQRPPKTIKKPVQKKVVKKETPVVVKKPKPSIEKKKVVKSGGSGISSSSQQNRKKKKRSRFKRKKRKRYTARKKYSCYRF